MAKESVQLDQPNVLSMSDDELSRLDINQYLEQNQESLSADTPPEQTENPEPEQSEPEASEPEAEEQQENSEDNADGAEPAEEPAEPSEPESENTETQPDPESQNVPDYKAFHDAILGKPIKANGREIIIQNPEDVIKLVQMGANYHDKMAALKPSRRIMKMLEKENLLNEADLGFLIDLHKKDPKAIAKLVQDSQIDLMDFDTTQSEGYAPQHAAPSEADITLEDTVNELSSTPGFKDVLTNITTTWDVDSQNLIAQNPEILRVLNTAKEKGHFDLIVGEMAKERMLGRLGGNSIQAYTAIENRLMAEGKLGTPAPQNEAAKPAPATPKKDVAKAKKAAAAPRQTVAGKKSLPDNANLFALSDEEFAKIDPSQFKF